MADSTNPTPYSGSTRLGAIGRGNYGTTSEQLDTSGGNAYSEGAAGGPPSQWQNGGLAEGQFIALNPQGK